MSTSETKPFTVEISELSKEDYDRIISQKAATQLSSIKPEPKRRRISKVPDRAKQSSVRAKQNSDSGTAAEPEANTVPLWSGPAVADSGLAPLTFDNINDLFTVVYPHVDLHTWQIEEQMRISGYLDPASSIKYEPTDKQPIKEYLVANNSAGKDSTLIAPAIAWLLLTKVKAGVVLTSASHRQLKNQTEKNIRNFCDACNSVFGTTVLEYKDLHIYCPLTASECIMFATDKAGNVEGYHPIEPGRELMIILNEVKSVPDEIITAVLRCFGYTRWIEVSSAGLVDTHFHRMVKSATTRYPEIPEPGESFTRTITVDDCPHISDDNKQALIDDCGGPDSPIALAALWSQFIFLDAVYIIPSHFFDYDPPAVGMLGNKLRAGLDLALGGAEAVLSVFKGNEHIGQEPYRISSEPKLTRVLVEAFGRYDLKPSQINGDAGGMGLPILQRLEEAGWPINRVRNEAKAFRKVYRNRGTENWWTVRRLIQDKILKLIDDPKLKNQLKKRRYKIYDDNTLMVEPKSEAAARGEESPDRADGLVLAFADFSVDDVHRSTAITPVHKVAKHPIDLTNIDEAEEKIRGWIASGKAIRVGSSLMQRIKHHRRR